MKTHYEKVCNSEVEAQMQCERLNRLSKTYWWSVEFSRNRWVVRATVNPWKV